MRRYWLLVAGTVVVASVAGCAESMAKRAFKEAVGPSAKALERSEHADFAAIDGLQVGDVGNRALGLCPADFTSALATALADEAKASSDFTGETTPATIRAEVVHYESPDLLGAALSPKHEAIILVSVMGDDGADLAEFTVIGDSESMRTTPADLAKVMAKQAVAHLETCKTGKAQVAGVLPVVPSALTPPKPSLPLPEKAAP